MMVPKQGIGTAFELSPDCHTADIGVALGDDLSEEANSNETPAVATF